MIDAVVFDMDGVITDTASVHRLAWKRMFDGVLAEAAERTGTPLRPFDDQDYYQHVDGKLRQDGVASVLASRGIALDFGSVDDPPDRDTVWGLANRKNRDFTETIAQSGVVAFPSSVALVRSLQEHGVGTAIISASRNCALILRAAGIGDLFPVRVDGIEAERLGLPGKPSPAVFLEAARRLGAQPARAVVVEDALAGVAAGRAGGFGLVVGVDRTGEAEALMAHGADVVVDDLAQLRVVA
jgi:beta-phosphoglucomutase family hydrolase